PIKNKRFMNLLQVHSLFPIYRIQRPSVPCLMKKAGPRVNRLMNGYGGNLETTRNTIPNGKITKCAKEKYEKTSIFTHRRRSSFQKNLFAIFSRACKRTGY